MISVFYITSSFYPTHSISSRAGAGNMVQRVEVLATNPDNLNSIPHRWSKPSLTAVLSH